EHLESRMATAVDELKAERLLAVQMARLFDSEDRPDLPPADVHVQGLRLDVEEVARGAEIPERTICLQGCCPVGDDDVHLAERLQSADQLFPALGVELNGPVVGKGPKDLDLWHPELAGQEHRHLIRVFPDGCLDSFSGFHELILWIRLFVVGEDEARAGCEPQRSRAHQSFPRTSPPAGEPSACQVARAILLVTKRTLPSHMQTLTPPGCMLRGVTMMLRLL